MAEDKFIIGDAVSSPGVVNVRSFGAKGDGVTDDTAAIQAALSELLYGGVLFFPKGIYLTESLDLTDKKNVVIRGHNETTTQPWNNGSRIKAKTGTDVLIKCSTRGSAVPTKSGTAILIENIYVDCNNNAEVGINLNFGVTVKNTIVRYAKTDGIVFEGQTYPARLENVFSQYNKRHGIYIKAPNTTVYNLQNCEFGFNDGYGMLIEDGSTASFKNVLCQSNKRGGVKVVQRPASDFTLPVFLERLSFEGLYTEANGTLPVSDPNYEGNFALILQGRNEDPLSYSGKLSDFTFTNCSINFPSQTGQQVKIRGTKNLSVRNCFGLLSSSVEPLTNIQHPSDGLTTESVSSTASRSNYQQEYKETILRSLSKNVKVGSGYVGNRGKYRELKFYTKSVQTGVSVIMDTEQTIILGIGAKCHSMYEKGSAISSKIHLLQNKIASGRLTFEVWTGYRRYNDPFAVKRTSLGVMELAASDMDVSETGYGKGFSHDFFSTEFDANAIIGVRVTASADFNWVTPANPHAVEFSILIED